ncbi:MAG: YcgN family cysteine cluster protein [Gammaproteobacteria bacterium]|nr:YcgN family cysteine cluster protein [Gammaproteobacteria bacterium]
MTDEFWKRKSLREMSRDEWESLCDGCALCCLHKLENEETGEVFFTDIACKLLDTESCRCTDYSARAKRVADCLVLSVDDPETFEWLPGTCAYRRLANGDDLPEWHPLITGDSDSVHAAGISVKGRVRSERDTNEIRSLWKLD